MIHVMDVTSKNQQTFRQNTNNTNKGEKNPLLVYLKMSGTKHSFLFLSHPYEVFLTLVLTVVIVSAAATMSASPALMMCSSRSLSMGSIPLGTLSMSENIRCSSGGDRQDRLWFSDPNTRQEITSKQAYFSSFNINLSKNH